jgi:hypothetical protein
MLLRKIAKKLFDKSQNLAQRFLVQWTDSAHLVTGSEGEGGGGGGGVTGNSLSCYLLHSTLHFTFYPPFFEDLFMAERRKCRRVENDMYLKSQRVPKFRKWCE